MRIYALVVCLVLGSSSTALAQGPTMGVKAGVNFASLNFEDDGTDVSFDRRTGLAAGVFALWPMGGRLALQTEALFSQKGAKVEEEGATGKIKLDYLDVPILLRVSSAPSGQTSFHVFGGPSLGFRLRARAAGTAEGETSNEDISEDIERFDFGVVVGAGVEVGRITLDARQSWGLTDLNKESTDGLAIKNRVFSIMAGFRF